MKLNWHVVLAQQLPHIPCLMPGLAAANMMRPALMKSKAADAELTVAAAHSKMT
jgi:hypothetical protein